MPNAIPYNEASKLFGLQEWLIFTEEECDEIKKYCLEKEKELIASGSEHHDENLTTAITTNNYFKFNFFQDYPKYAERFVKFLTETGCPLEWPIIAQSWINVLRKDQGINWHTHIGNMGQCFSANVFIDGPTKPGTSYLNVIEGGIKSQNIENKRGYMHVFPSNIYHKVIPLKEDTERISLGITVHGYNAIQNSKAVIKGLAMNTKSPLSDSVILTNDHLLPKQQPSPPNRYK